MELRSRRLVPAAMAVALSGLLFPVLAAAAGYSQTAELSASNGSAADSFGYASALSSDGSTALVGAPLISLGAGEAYVYAPSGSGWTQQSTLLPNDAAGGDTFGSAVALSSNGDIALVGAPEQEHGHGRGVLLREERLDVDAGAGAAAPPRTPGSEVGLLEQRWQHRARRRQPREFLGRGRVRVRLQRWHLDPAAAAHPHARVSGRGPVR